MNGPAKSVITLRIMRRGVESGIVTNEVRVWRFAASSVDDRVQHDRPDIERWLAKNPDSVREVKYENFTLVEEGMSVGGVVDALGYPILVRPAGAGEKPVVRPNGS
jgi:hypothetical protein